MEAVLCSNMTAADPEVIEAGWEVIGAFEDMQAALAKSAALLRESVKRLEEGEDIVEILRSVPVAPIRSSGKSADDALNEARIRFRSRVFTACLTGGMSRKEIANRMGVSPQLVSRHLKSVREAD